MSNNSSGPLLINGIRNSIIGGDFSTNPWQRGYSAAVTGAGVYTADRWKCARGSSASGMTVGRGALSIGDVPGTLHFLRAQRDSGNSATNTLVVSQSITTADSRALNQRVITLSFWARKGADFTGSYSAAIYFGQGTDQDVLPGFTSSTSSSTSIALTTSWQKFTFTVAVGGFSQAAVYFQHTPSGTASTNDWVDLALVQLAPSLPGEPFLHRSAFEELALCRHFHNIVNGSATMMGLTGSPNGYWGYHAFPVEMRATPTITVGSALDMIAGGFVTLASTGKNTKALYSAGESGNNTTSLITFSWSATAEL
jgi:hypothetical protein